jgi:uncharacterized protein YutE (UPF0331/DUF86 family)
MKVTVELDEETYKAFKVLADFRKISVEQFIGEDLQHSIQILKAMEIDSFIEALKKGLQQKSHEYAR